MAKQFPGIAPAHRKFIEKQHIFFVGSAAADGRVNVSPKGMDSLRVVDENRILWRNLTGSGNETAGHLKQVNRMTIMWCGFEQQTMIMRAYGTASTLHRHDDGFDELNAHFPSHRGARQIYDMTVDLLQTSCGYAVPYFDFVGERDTLTSWTEDRDDATLRAYQKEKNMVTLDGAPTGIFGDEA